VSLADNVFVVHRARTALRLQKLIDGALDDVAVIDITASLGQPQVT
jgi:hypothetical protein